MRTNLRNLLLLLVVLPVALPACSQLSFGRDATTLQKRFEIAANYDVAQAAVLAILEDPSVPANVKLVIGETEQMARAAVLVMIRAPLTDRGSTAAALQAVARLRVALSAAGARYSGGR